MAEDESKSLDILGLKPYADSVKILTQAAVDGAGAFLSRICLPASEEFGLALRERVNNWRTRNQVQILNKGEKKLKTQSNADKKYAHPRLVAAILEHGSWYDEDIVQEMWAGLLASSCTETGNDDSNLIFINILSQITSLQAPILNYCCVNSPAVMTTILCDKKDQFLKISSVNINWREPQWNSDLSRMIRELEHLLALNLIKDASHPDKLRPVYQSLYVSEETSSIPVMPTPLALHLYVRCQGYTGSPEEYFKLSQIKSS